MSDAMNNPYANNPNQNGGNGQQPQGHPEYGAYAPNQQSQSQQQGGNPNNSGNPYQSEPQTPCYFDGPNANPNPNQNGFFYASYTTGQPYGQPYGQQNSQSDADNGTNNWQPISHSSSWRNGSRRRQRTRSAARMRCSASPPSFSAWHC